MAELARGEARTMDAATMAHLRAVALQRRVRAAVRGCLADEIAAMQAMLTALEGDCADNGVPDLSSHR